jgi:hypothetical protein
MVGHGNSTVPDWWMHTQMDVEDGMEACDGN